MDEVASSETSYASTKIYGVISHESPLRESYISHPYIAFMITPYLFNSWIDQEMYYTYLILYRPNFLFVFDNKQFKLS